MRTVQVVSGLELAHGGPSYSVPRLNAALRQAGVDARVFADVVPGEAVNDADPGVVIFKRQFGGVPGLRKLHISTALSNGLSDTTDRIDLIHSHGLWRMPNVYAAKAALKRGIPHVISPRGMLSTVALEFSSHSKKIFWLTGQKAAVERAACLHATSASEYEEIRAAGIRCPVAVIPNGVDFPDVDPPVKPIDGAHGSRVLLYLGRIHPKKGLSVLVSAWAQVASSYPGWSLRIVGPGERDDIEGLVRFRDELGAPRVTIAGPVYGREKWNLYSRASVFVLPTFNENFGLTVAESLSCRRPVIVTKGAPWQGVEVNGCGWWIDTGETALVQALRHVLAKPDDVLDEMGRRGEAWVKRAFSWPVIGSDMAAVYRWLRGEGERPPCIELS